MNPTHQNINPQTQFPSYCLFLFFALLPFLISCSAKRSALKITTLDQVELPQEIKKKTQKPPSLSKSKPKTQKPTSLSKSKPKTQKPSSLSKSKPKTQKPSSLSKSKPKTQKPSSLSKSKPKTQKPSSLSKSKPKTQKPSSLSKSKPKTQKPSSLSKSKPKTQKPSSLSKSKPKTQKPSSLSKSKPKTQKPSSLSKSKPKTQKPSSLSKSKPKTQKPSSLSKSKPKTQKPSSLSKSKPKTQKPSSLSKSKPKTQKPSSLSKPKLPQFQTLEQVFQNLNEKLKKPKPSKFSKLQFFNPLGYQITLPQSFSQNIDRPQMWSFTQKTPRSELKILIGTVSNPQITPLKNIVQDIKQQYSSKTNIQWLSKSHHIPAINPKKYQASEVQQIVGFVSSSNNQKNLVLIQLLKNLQKTKTVILTTILSEPIPQNISLSNPITSNFNRKRINLIFLILKSFTFF